MTSQKISEEKAPGKKLSWCDVLKVHPAAEWFESLSQEELLQLGEDIQTNGLTSPIVVWSPGAMDDRGAQEVLLLDGRNRLDSCRGGRRAARHGR